jgi:MerC mercury resistance protein
LQQAYFCRRMLKKINWDALGISASLACAIHCAILPLFLSSLPIFGLEILHNKLFEYCMIMAAAVIGTISLSHGVRKHHHKKLPVIIFLCGISLLFAKEIFIRFEIWLLVPAAAMIISAHIINYRYCRMANHCHAGDCSHERLV